MSSLSSGETLLDNGGKFAVTAEEGRGGKFSGVFERVILITLTVAVAEVDGNGGNGVLGGWNGS